jgi:hypothetical protein
VTKIIATFSIVGFDPETDSLGVAVQSKFLAVGSVVPWARAGVGAVATQAMANYNYGPHGLELMARGKTADETVEGLTFADEDREHRQVGAVDARGRAATFTGSECFEWAGGVTGEYFAATSSSVARPSKRWREPTQRRRETSPHGCSRRWTRGRRLGETPGESSRRRCSSYGRAEVTAGTMTGQWICGWMTIPTP